jgi:glycosyltransferase involved in cell wall biosynthesis
MKHGSDSGAGPDLRPGGGTRVHGTAGTPADPPAGTGAPVPGPPGAAPLPAPRREQRPAPGATAPPGARTPGTSDARTPDVAEPAPDPAPTGEPSARPADRTAPGDPAAPTAPAHPGDPGDAAVPTGPEEAPAPETPAPGAAAEARPSPDHAPAEDPPTGHAPGSAPAPRDPGPVTRAPAPEAPAPEGPAPRLSVVVPAYNEESRLRATLDAIGDHLRADPEQWGDWELIVVDDGSTDATAAIAAEAAAAEPRIRTVTAPENRGKGNALRLGVLASRGRRVLLTDADLATPIEELDRLDLILTMGRGTAAIGSRALPESRIEIRQAYVRELLGRLGNALIRAVAVPGIRDTQCGFKLIDGPAAREAFAASRLDGWGIDIEILHQLRRSGHEVVEVPVRWSHRDGSKVAPLDYARTAGELLLLRLRVLGRADLLVSVLFLLGSVLLYQDLWRDLDRGYLADAGQDQNQWEWFFAVTADNLSHFRNPLFTTAQNFPDGVNLMGNTVMLGVSLPLTPVTLLLGASVTWAVVLTGGLALTAFAWYRLFLRRLVTSRWAAATGAGLAAFAPPMISHGNAHPNFLVLFVIPLIIGRALSLCEGRAVVRDGVLLGLLAAYQIHMGEEALLLAAMGMVFFALAHAALDRDHARRALRPLLRGTGIGLAVCLPLVAFPLTWQFFGPQSYSNVLHGDNTMNSPRAFMEFAGRSLLGSDERADPLAMNRTEQNAFYGWPLIALATAIVVRWWRSVLVRALAITAVTAALFSLGSRFRVPATDLVLPGPWALLADAPLFEAVIESRVAMICAPVLGMLVAYAADRLLRSGPRLPDGRPAARGVRALGLGAIALALLPILPTPYPVRERAEVPRFIAEGHHRRYLGPGESLVTVPLPSVSRAEALHWQSREGFDLPLAGGYFVGPWGPERLGIYGSVPRHTSHLFQQVRESGAVPAIGPEQREQARHDLAAWDAGVLILLPQPNEEALYETVRALLRDPGERAGGAWVWDLRKEPARGPAK